VVLFSVVTCLIAGMAVTLLASTPVAADESTDITNKDTASFTSKLNVVTSISPISNIIKNIGGDRIELATIVPEGSDSHTFELIPSDAVKINDADIVIIDGLHLEPGIEKVVAEAKIKNPRLQLLRLGDSTINQTQLIYDFNYPKEKGDPNPHLWLDVDYAIKFANLTRDKLIETDPKNTDYYNLNTDRYVTLLHKLDTQIKKAVETIPPQNRKLLTYHDSWAYFATRYGMIVIGAVQPSEFGEPNPQDVARLIDQIDSQKVPAIFASKVFPSKVVDQIAREANVTFVQTLNDDVLPGKPGDPNHSYVGMMLENMKNMVVPLGGKVDGLTDIDPQDTYLKGG